ncbi:hypothetical protein ES703_77172 [subsurface metagenome]
MLKIDYVSVAKEGGESGGGFTDYGPTGAKTESSTTISGTDAYGREWNKTVTVHYKMLGGSTKPISRVTYRTVTRSTGFSHTSTVKLSYEYDEVGHLMGGSGSEVFSGSLPGGVTYSGSSNITCGVLEGALAWTKRIEQASYFNDGKLYAETLTITVPESAKSPVFYRPVRETELTTTTYADGGRRESNIVILYDWDDVGNNIRKNASGTVKGTDIVEGSPVDYSALITITYVNIGGVWEKVGFEEKRSSEASLAKRLPFEVIFCDDHALRLGL